MGGSGARLGTNFEEEFVAFIMLYYRSYVESYSKRKPKRTARSPRPPRRPFRGTKRTNDAIN